MTEQNGITLIGMSGAGKTTLGPLLGERLGWPISDVDSIIVEREGRLIGQIVKEEGQERLLELETECVNQQDLHRRVLVTPGSIVYDVGCHQKLKDETTIVWLDVPLETLKDRFGQDSKKQGAVLGAESGFETLYNERRSLYVALADVAISCGDKTPFAIAQEIIEQTQA